MGNLTGSTSMQHSGMEERTQAEAEYKAAQAKGYTEGTMDRMSGLKDSMMGSVKGDEGQKAAGKLNGEGGGA